MAGSRKIPVDSDTRLSNYYQTLGVRKNATPTSIKKKYIELVKTFPPENYPEEFQAIRKAYEVLRDPEQRSQYDRACSGLKTVDDLLTEIGQTLEQRKWPEAKAMIINACRQYPEEKQFVGMLGMACSGLGETQQVQQCFAAAFELEGDLQEILTILSSYILVMCAEGYCDEALQMVKDSETRFAAIHNEWQELLIATYLLCERQDELISLADSLIPAKESSGIAAIKALIDAINIIVFLEKWDRLGKYQTRMRKLLKDLAKPRDKSSAKKMFRERYKYYKADNQFRAAAEFMDFICRLDPKDTKARQQLVEIKSLQAFSRFYDYD